MILKVADFLIDINGCGILVRNTSNSWDTDDPDLQPICTFLFLYHCPRSSGDSNAFPMKFDLVSDLHEDINNFHTKPANPGSEILVIAGDLAEASFLRASNYASLKEYLDYYEEVIYVAGNHEYYGTNIQAVNNMLADECDRLGVRFLQCGTFEVPGTNVAFVGATLWTDMNGEDAATMHQIKQVMADWTYIGYKDDSLVGGDPLMVNRFSPQQSANEFHRALQYIEDECDRLNDRSVVVVTHHAMSTKSIVERFQNQWIMNGGFASDCDWFFHKHKNVKVHCHGHMHDYLRYNLGSATVYCNPYGYQKYMERKPHYGPLQIEVK